MPRMPARGGTLHKSTPTTPTSTPATPWVGATRKGWGAVKVGLGLLGVLESLPPTPHTPPHPTLTLMLLLLLLHHHATHGGEHGLLLLYELHLLVEHGILLHLMEAHGCEHHHGVVLLLLLLRVHAAGVHPIPHLAHVPTTTGVARVRVVVASTRGRGWGEHTPPNTPRIAVAGTTGQVLRGG